ncbi:hypothetical protein WICPIJ_008080 [Wickerhamomyces pijperi]|uniref:Uncharacterized protein n=1 Tax=Wickerhamomyces pijperi TaxID=599730 RepID=A0A9P8PYG3_WICPI|nr:hypothetical protein WICPIJ_008080 [Wickerhamomyces pijperi]
MDQTNPLERRVFSTTLLFQIRYLREPLRFYRTPWNHINIFQSTRCPLTNNNLLNQILVYAMGLLHLNIIKSRETSNLPQSIVNLSPIDADMWRIAIFVA